MLEAIEECVDQRLALELAAGDQKDRLVESVAISQRFSAAYPNPRERDGEPSLR